MKTGSLPAAEQILASLKTIEGLDDRLVNEVKEYTFCSTKKMFNSTLTENTVEHSQERWLVFSGSSRVDVNDWCLKRHAATISPAPIRNL